jgi:hypothetical protein
MKARRTRATEAGRIALLVAAAAAVAHGDVGAAVAAIVAWLSLDR